MIRDRQAVIDQLASALERGSGVPVPDEDTSGAETAAPELDAHELDAELRELVHLARIVGRDSVVPAPDPAFRARLRSEVVAFADRAPAVQEGPVGTVERLLDSVREHTRRVRHSAKMGLATGLASMMVGSAGVAVAAQEAMPGEMLYPVKRWTETAQMALASGTVETGRLHLRFAEERLEEVVDSLGEVPPNITIDTLKAMDEATLAGARDLLHAYRALGDPELLHDLGEFARHQRHELSTVFPNLTAEVRPFADESLEILRRLGTQIESASDVCEGCGEPSNLTPALFAPGEGPAVASGCDCIGRVRNDPAATTDDTDTTDTEESTSSDPLTESTEQLEEEATDPSLESGEETVDNTVDEVGESLEETTDETRETVEETVDEGESLLEETTDSLEDTVESTVDSLL